MKASKIKIKSCALARGSRLRRSQMSAVVVSIAYVQLEDEADSMRPCMLGHISL